MCGIAGFWNLPDASKQLMTALLELESRGRDAAGAVVGEMTEAVVAATPEALPALPLSTVALGQTLHAMVGYLPQPLIGAIDSQTGKQSRLIANCELYTWRKRAAQEGLSPRNDADLLLLLLDALPDLSGHCVSQLLSSLDGTYAFAYERSGTVVVARDILGVKPIWYSVAQGLAVASTRDALLKVDTLRVEELSPRSVLFYDCATSVVSVHRREFFSQPDVTVPGENANELLAQLTAAANEAIIKRVPQNDETRTALFLGGGVDSAVLATVLGSLPAERRPMCYTVAKPGSKEARAATAIAAVAGLSHKIITPSSDAIIKALPRVLRASDDINPVKISVGLVTALASEAAALDGCTCAISGLGVDEAFATLARHQSSTDRTLEAIASLRKLHERELTREDTIAMSYGVELRLPFLDLEFVELALRTLRSPLDEPAGNKRAFRLAAEELGVPEVIASLPRKAPQYGSGVMHALILLARRAHCSSVAEYIALKAETGAMHSQKSEFEGKRVAVLLSGGKDSVLAAHILHSMRYTLACAITIESDNPDSYLYHTPNTAAAALQAQSMRLPFITARTHGEQELELSALREALIQAVAEHQISGVVTGAIGSHYQRERIEKLCDELGLTVYSPLWQMNQLAELRMLLAQQFRVVFTKVAAEGLSHDWLGEELTNSRIAQLAKLQETYGVHPAGEGGEYESLVLDAPLFRERLEIRRAEVIKDGLAGTLHIHDIALVSKQPASNSD